MDRVAAAIVTRWTSQALGTSFPGGIFVDMAPRDTDFPYVILRMREESPKIVIQDLEMPAFRASFDVYYQEDGSTDPVSSLGTLMRSLTAAYDWAPLVYTGRSNYEVRRGTQRTMLLDVDRRIWLGQVDYVITTQRSVTCSPA